MTPLKGSFDPKGAATCRLRTHRIDAFLTTVKKSLPKAAKERFALARRLRVDSITAGKACWKEHESGHWKQKENTGTQLTVSLLFSLGPQFIRW